jgi:hypothetical protein
MRDDATAGRGDVMDIWGVPALRSRSSKWRALYSPQLRKRHRHAVPNGFHSSASFANAGEKSVPTIAGTMRRCKLRGRMNRTLIGP